MFGFEEEAEVYINHFALKCSLVKYASTLVNHKTERRLNYFDINEKGILSIIKNLMQVKLISGIKHRLE